MCYGAEFIAIALRQWIAAVGSQTAYIEPGSPRENGYCESIRLGSPRGGRPRLAVN